MSSFVHHFKAIGEFKLTQFGSTLSCVTLNLTGDLEQNRLPFLCYFKFCASFYIHQWIISGVTVWKRKIVVKIGYCLSRVTLKFEIWPWKTIWHVSYDTSSLVHHSSHRWIQTRVTVRKRPIRGKICDFSSCVTLKFDGWPWKIIEHRFDITWQWPYIDKTVVDEDLTVQGAMAAQNLLLT